MARLLPCELGNSRLRERRVSRRSRTAGFDQVNAQKLFGFFSRLVAQWSSLFFVSGKLSQGQGSTDMVWTGSRLGIGWCRLLVSEQSCKSLYGQARFLVCACADRLRFAPDMRDPSLVRFYTLNVRVWDWQSSFQG